jgi:hypothetical protein
VKVLHAALAGLLASGCGSLELEAQRNQQAELMASIESLRSDFHSMKADYDSIAMAAPSRKADPAAEVPRTNRAGGWIGNQTPGQELSSTLDWRVDITGSPVALPKLEAPTRTETTCGWVFEAPGLKPLSDLVLRRSGMGRASPILLLEDHNALASHADDQHETYCAGAFRHAGTQFQFSPRGVVDAVPKRTYALAHAEQPVERADGRPLYWVVPGTQFALTMSEPWQPAWGKPTLDLVIKAIGPHEGRLMVRVGRRVGLEDKAIVQKHIDLTAAELDGSWRLLVSSPVDGPYVVIDTLTLGNPRKALVVTGEGAYLARKNE